ncbi:MAG TPA: formimidoylglutamate deiminase [Gemmatimonadota bacterium]|nr:formimidoylglutamate deiminase [Gemmatimonadota bacterium]
MRGNRLMPAAGQGTASVVEADLVWTGERFESGVRIAIGADGRIEAVGAGAGPAGLRLAGQALLPGLVSAHSHAFQRGLRGRGQTFSAGCDDFWSWREAMYGLAGSVDRDRFRGLCRAAFGEMRDAGITAVGEFHYLRHSAGARDRALDGIVLDAAAETGIRIALLPAYYRTGGFGRPLEGAQARFETPSPEAYWEGVDELAGRLDPRTQSVGAAAHSVRAAEPDEIAALREEAAGRGLVFHLHLEEQRREVEECWATYGAPPIRLLLDAFAGDAGNAVGIHLTQSSAEDVEAWIRAGGSVCACPLTEGDLGDGIAKLDPAVAAPGRLSLGTDSNQRIDLTEEMRWLEYGQRLTTGRRGVVVDGSGSAARRLLLIATAGGADAIGVEAGRIEPGRWADLVALDLAHPALAGAVEDESADEHPLLAAWVFGAGRDAVAATCVAGRWREGRARALPA